jgi:hypothetical protein
VTAGEPPGQGDGIAVVAPRLLAFYQDAWDDDGTAMGWRTVGWGLVLSDGSAITIPVEAPVRVTVWRSVHDAVADLDAYVDDLGPRRSIEGGSVFPQSSGFPPTAGVEGAAGPTACPVDPAIPARVQGRPSGTSIPCVGGTP